MYHSMAIGAEQRQVGWPGLMALNELVNRRRVMRLDEARASVAVRRAEIEIARLATQLAQLGQRGLFAAPGDPGAALAGVV